MGEDHCMVYGSKYVFLVSNKPCFRECLIWMGEDHCMVYGSKYVFFVSNKPCFRECLIWMGEDITTVKHVGFNIPK